MTDYYWGVDPAWKNMGVVVLDSQGKVVWSATVNPSEKGFSGTLDDLPFQEYPCKAITIERYVAYSGAQSKYSEHILMMIGALVYCTKDSDQLFFRAIDWKTGLVKQESRLRGFSNPSTSLDKKYSLAMAQHLTGVKFKTDHEADAACLAYLGYLKHAEDLVCIGPTSRD